MQNRAEVSIGNRVYGAETTAEDFIAYFTPAVLLDSSLYKSTETSQSDGITMFSFSEATAPEQWAIPANAAIIDAHGNATLDNEGNLISSSYHISYTNGPASVLDKITVTISPSTEISYIDDVESTSITSIFAPEQLEIACMYLKNAGDISSEIVHIVRSEAFSVEREQTTQLSLTGSGESLTVDITATTTQQSISKKSEPTVLSQNIHFRNGKYTVSADEGEAITADVSWEQMQKYCSSLLTENIPIIDQLTAIESEYAEDNLLIKFQTTDYLSDRICEQISNILYGDSTFITGISSEVVTTGATGYITIDLQTGLPSSSGIFYETTHSIDGKDYKLSSQIEQKYSIAK
jgi:hypothetical protein